MIRVYYGEYACLHHRQEIKRARWDIEHHNGIECIRHTGSEHYILTLCQAIRQGKLRTDEIELYCEDKRIDLDTKGEFIQPWPDDLFEADFYLRFDCK